jgi:hypothetical protein
VVGVVLAGGLLWALTVLISNRTVTPRGPFTADEFTVGRVASIADRVPFLLPDASPSHERDLYVQHLGDDLDRGWLAFAALAPGQTDRGCFLKWRADHFEDPCTGKTFPPDGTGLTAYPTRVANGRLYVDVND